MGLFNIVLCALLVAYVEGAPSTCGGTYQKLLKDLVTLKEKCELACFKDCCQIKELLPQASSGVYDVASACHVDATFISSKSYAHCDMDTDGGKWTVIQRRINGSVDFYRNWTDYANGFGDLDGEFWYGLDNIHCLTTHDDVELRIEIGNGTKPSIVWTYQLFRVGGADTNYLLTIGPGQTVGGSNDAMAFQNGHPFSTRDRDNDAWDRNCATVYGGAWWYGACFRSNLNGGYEYHPAEDGAARLVWYDGAQFAHFTRVEMKVRPKRCVAATCN